MLKLDRGTRPDFPSVLYLPPFWSHRRALNPSCKHRLTFHRLQPLGLSLHPFAGHSHLVWGEIMLILNCFNVTALYFRHLRLPFLVHIPVVASPLARSFVILFTNGAAMVNACGTAARILANIAVWTFLVYGLFFLAAFQDYGMGLAISFLVAGEHAVDGNAER